MSAYWDSKIVRVPLPEPYNTVYNPNEGRANYMIRLIAALKDQRDAIDEQLRMLEPIAKVFKDVVCPGCMGSGKMRRSVDMDSTELFPCTVCKGTGAPDAD